MSSFFLSLNSFNAGELSPRMLGRNDVSQYGKGCEKLLNFFVTPYGSVERRPGTFDCGAAKGSGGVRLIRFVVSSTISYICEFGNLYVRFWKDGAPVPATGTRLELSSVYTDSELENIQFVQSADIMTLVHPAHPVYELRRIANDVFTLTPKTWEYPPMLDPNNDDNLKISATPLSIYCKADDSDVFQTLYRDPERDGTKSFAWVSGSGTVKAWTASEMPAEGSPTYSDSGLTAKRAVHVEHLNVTLTASRSLFQAGHVGAYFELIHPRKETEIYKKFKSNDTSESLEVKGFWSFSTHGTWTGNILIERSFDGGTNWIPFRSYTSANDSNVSTSGEEDEDGVLYHLKMEDYSAAQTGTIRQCRARLVNPGFMQTGVVKVTAVASGTSATATIVKKVGSTDETSEWSEGAFSTLRGFPRSIAYFEERMMFGGTAFKPQTVWGSKTGDWDNFLLGDKDDNGLEFTLASDTINEIGWMCQHNALVIGTADSEWTLSASSSDAALTPTNFQVKRQSVYGTSKIPALMAGETILFVQRGERKVREFVYSWEKDGYNCPDMTILADHITASGVVETALMQLPDTILWCLLSNGTLAALTYERDQEVVGWHRHELAAGHILSIAVVPNGSEDVLYLAAQLNESVRILRMAGRSEQFFVDYGKKRTTSSSIPNILLERYLSDEDIQVVADGAIEKAYTKSGTVVTLDNAATASVVYGLGYTSELTTMPLEIETQNGQSLLRKKTVGEIRLRYYNSIGGEAKSGASDWQMIQSRDVIVDDMDRAITLKSDVSLLNPLSGYSMVSNVSVRQRDPMPFNLTSIVVTYDVVEK